jgi:hypothetical protein
MLSPTQLTQAQLHINNMPKGTYTLKSIFGISWQNISNKNLYGKDFKDSVNAGQLSNIVFNKIKSNNHNTYNII